MKLAVQILSISALLCSSSCQDYKLFMPQTISALNGSCVTIPCTFTLPLDWSQDLSDLSAAAWYKDSPHGTLVFHSGLSGASASFNILQGTLTGNLQEKDCTTTLHNLSVKDRGRYYFTLDTDPDNVPHYQTWGYTSERSVLIDVTDSLPPPTVTPRSLEVLEGTRVSLKCSALAPCSSLPPALEWTPSFGDIEVSMEGEYVTSVMTFTASSLHHGQEVSCSALYPREDGSNVLLRGNSVTPRVLFVSEILPSSRCVETACLVRCSCDSRGNPPPSLLWELDGEPVTHSADIAIQEVPLGRFGMRSLITLHQLNKDVSSLVCLSINPLGSDRFAFNVSLSETQPGPYCLSHVIGSTVGALGMMLVCVLLLLFFWMKRTDISSFYRCWVDTDEANSVIVSYVNNAFQGEEAIAPEENDL